MSFAYCFYKLFFLYILHFVFFLSPFTKTKIMYDYQMRITVKGNLCPFTTFHA